MKNLRLAWTVFFSFHVRIIFWPSYNSSAARCRYLIVFQSSGFLLTFIKVHCVSVIKGAKFKVLLKGLGFSLYFVTQCRTKLGKKSSL